MRYSVVLLVFIAIVWPPVQNLREKYIHVRTANIEVRSSPVIQYTRDMKSMDPTSRAVVQHIPPHVFLVFLHLPRTLRGKDVDNLWKVSLCRFYRLNRVKTLHIFSRTCCIGGVSTVTKAGNSTLYRIHGALQSPFLNPLFLSFSSSLASCSPTTSCCVSEKPKNPEGKSTSGICVGSMPEIYE